MKKILLFCCAVMTVAVLQAQNTIHVPGDFPTIQEGINAAAAGDIVLVSDGIYFEQITFPPFPLTVASEYLTTGDASHIENTVIDGDSITEMDSASVVYFISGQDTTSVLCGFTIRHGKGTFGVIGSETFRAGGVFIFMRQGQRSSIIILRITT